MRKALRVGLVPVAALLVLGIAAPATAQVQVDVVFTTQERTQIREYYVQHQEASTEALPPGIRKNLARGKRLPPGIARKALPAQLETRLPSRDGYQRVQVGLDVFLVEVATGIIHDVLTDVIRGL